LPGLKKNLLHFKFTCETAAAADVAATGLLTNTILLPPDFNASEKKALLT